MRNISAVKDQNWEDNFNKDQIEKYYICEESKWSFSHSIISALILWNLWRNSVFELWNSSVQADDAFLNDDASSESSVNSFKYSNVNLCEPGTEDDQQHDANYKCTRFCPPQELEANYNKQTSNRRMDCCGCGHHGSSSRLTRMRSYMDVRSQPLQRYLMEDIHKRRMFKTVGAIENIGFQDPTWR